MDPFLTRRHLLSHAGLSHPGLSLCGLMLITAGLCSAAPPQLETVSPGYLEPVACGYWETQQQLVLLGSAGRRLVLVDASTGASRRSIALPGPGSALLVREHVAYVAICLPAGQVLQLDLNTGSVLRRMATGHSPTALALSADAGTLCVANRFDNTVTIVQLNGSGQRTIPVLREPVALALTPDGRRLFVANHLPVVRPFLDDEHPIIAAEISVIDLTRGEVVDNVMLPNGSQGLRAMAMSPDQRIMAVTHILSNYTVPTMELVEGAMNRNALSLLRTADGAWLATVPLDDPQRGAANPWAIAFREAGTTQLLVSHAGSHELSLIDCDVLLERLAAQRPAEQLFDAAALQSMTGIRQRIAAGVCGPRSLTSHGSRVYVAGYFSDDVAVLDLDARPITASSLWQDPLHDMPPWRQGEQLFHEASLCHQQWQSCATCHPDGRSDVMYWDLLNDGIGNTKNTKSMLMSALTPPVMWRGVRPDARAAIQAGVHHIQFGRPQLEETDAIEAYLRRMPAVPSPYLNAAVLEPPRTDDASCAKCHHPGVPRGTLTDAAQRGKQIFEGKGGCVNCHPHPLFTNRQMVDPGLAAGVRYDVPSLVEVWRTAPYLHSGDALTLHETIADFNFMNRRGDTQSLTAQELDDLVEYLKSL